MAEIKGLLFDKDGTLYDFHGTWAAWCTELLSTLTEDEPEQMAALAAALRFDLANQRYEVDSPVIAGTPDAAVEAMLPLLPSWTFETLRAHIVVASLDAPLVEAAPLPPLLDALIGRGLRLGVSTNDAEEAALRQLETSGIRDRFAFVAGFDSGYGAKPEPGMQEGFLRATGFAPDEVVMVGDSLHDLHAGRAAGMRTVGVLTGPAPRAELEPFADVVLSDISALPGYLDTQPVAAAG